MKDQENSRLFVSYYGTPLSANLRLRIKDYFNKAGIKKTGSTILFRHCISHKNAWKRRDIRYIQQMLGHASIETTKIYTQTPSVS